MQIIFLIYYNNIKFTQYKETIMYNHEDEIPTKDELRIEAYNSLYNADQRLEQIWLDSLDKTIITYGEPNSMGARRIYINGDNGDI